MATAVKSIPTTRVIAQRLLTHYAEVSQEFERLKTERKPLEEEYQELRNKLQDCANRAIETGEFGDKTTASLEGGSFGYRNGTEKLAWNLDVAPAGQERTEAVCAVLKRLLPSAVKVSYDEKAIVKVWPHMPKLQEQLATLGVAGVVREQQFIISLK